MRLLRHITLSFIIALCMFASQPIAAQRQVLLFAGNYGSGITYHLADVVLYSGNTYISLNASNIGNTPPTTSTSTAYWLLLSYTNPGMVNPMTTQGDMIVGGAAGAPTRVAAGTSGKLWVSNGPGVAPSWQSAATGVTSISGDSFYTDNASSTGAVTLHAKNITARSVVGNNTGSAAGPSAIPLLGTDSNVATAGSLSGAAGTPICKDSNGGIDTTCPGGTGTTTVCTGLGSYPWSCYFQLADGTIEAWGSSGTIATGSNHTTESVSFPVSFTDTRTISIHTDPDDCSNGGGTSNCGGSWVTEAHPLQSTISTTGFTAYIGSGTPVGGGGGNLAGTIHVSWQAKGK